MGGAAPAQEILVAEQARGRQLASSIPPPSLLQFWHQVGALVSLDDELETVR